MTSSAWRVFADFRFIGVAGIGLLLSVGLAGQARAAAGFDFVLPQNEGYGISECLMPGMECGRVVADAWCEAHGHGHATAFGLTDDLTGSTRISADSTSAVAAGSVIIHCGE